VIVIEVTQAGTVKVWLPPVNANVCMAGPAPPVWTHPVAGEQLSTVQAMPSSQLIGSCAQPIAVEQLSVVHTLPSSQLITSCLQPVAGEQLSAVHALASSQPRGVWVQPPAGVQLSTVHMLPSSHPGAMCTQPVAGAQLSVVHPLLSSQLIGACTQPVAGEQLSAVHMSLSLQSTDVCRQMPPEQMSFVHGLPSSQPGTQGIPFASVPGSTVAPSSTTVVPASLFVCVVRASGETAGCLASDPASSLGF
jgi:hypothetical protein